MNQETPGMPATELNESQLTQVVGGITREEVMRIAEETRQQVRQHADQTAQHHGTSVASRTASVAVANVLDFGAFAGGMALGNVIAPKKKKENH